MPVQDKIDAGSLVIVTPRYDFGRKRKASDPWGYVVVATDVGPDSFWADVLFEITGPYTKKERRVKGAYFIAKEWFIELV